MNKAIEQLKSIKDCKQAGYADANVHASSREKLMQAIAHGQREHVQHHAEVRGGLAYLRFAFADLISSPAIGIASMALLLFGGLTTVSAASSSLPGDPLYGLKLATERAQLQLVSADKRAVLHTEFAERRLEEYLALDDAKRDTFAGPTLDAFRNQVEQAAGEIEKLKDQNSRDAVAAATEIDQKLHTLGASLDESQPMQEMEDVQQITKDASEQVTNVAVDIHEQEPEETTEDLQQLFKAQLITVTDKHTFNIGRINVIESIAIERDFLTRQDIRSYTQQLNESTDRIAEARQLAAAGGYRTAFDILRSVNESITEVERILTHTETRIIFEDEAELLDEATVSETDLETDPSPSPDGDEAIEQEETE